jgi:hypothetical protein
MASHDYFSDEFDIGYGPARHKIDALCRGIRSGEISPARAREEYKTIESEFMMTNPEKGDLFRMIYANRIERLCEQFSLGAPDGR